MSWNRLANATVLSEEIENRLKQMLRIDLEHLKVKVAEPITECIAESPRIYSWDECKCIVIR